MGNNIVIWKINGAAGTERKLVSLTPAPTSLDDATRRLPQGGYTTFRTFDGKRVMRMSRHYDRLEETAQLAGIPVRLNRERLNVALHELLCEARSSGVDSGDHRVRMILDLELFPGSVYLLVEPLPVPNERDYREGVRCITRQMHRDNPKAKLTHFIETSASVRESKPAGINEVIMIGADGRVLEGISSNFFAVKDGAIWTAEDGVLPGITRTLVLEVIREKGIPLTLEGIPADQLGTIDEAFITSASRAVLPVVEIDSKLVGDGKPGPVSQALLEAYLLRLDSELEEV